MSINARLAAAHKRAPILLPWSIGAIVLAIGYAWIFLASGSSPLGVLRSTLTNVGSAWVTGLLFAIGMRRALPNLGPAATLGFHLVVSAAFALSWYVIDITVQGWSYGSLVSGAQIRPFTGPAFLWQFFQGFAVYGALAGLVHAAIKEPPASVEEPKRTLPERLLLKTGDEMVTIEPGDIVAIIAADDYSEVRTRMGDHLVRRRLGEFESDLPDNFVRVHRSAIVNLDRVVRCEPAGSGRISVHLEGSEAVIASRAGAKILRERTL